MTEEETGRGTPCPGCGRAVPELQLRICPMCRNVFCPGCAVAGYGREFCGVNCRDMFFFGDGDETEDDF